MTSKTSIKDLLRSRKLAPKKRFGQNFLIHKHVAARIVDLAPIDPHDTIIELGVGFGALTTPLAQKAGRVIGLEIDNGIIRWHHEEGGLAANVILRHQDILTADFHELAEQCGGRLKIMANLPYSISNPLLFKLIEHRELMDWAILMLQKEVGQRLSARPATKEYGILTVLMGACASVSTLMNVGAGQFHPRPKVDSQVLSLTFQPTPERVAALEPHDRQLLTKVVRAAFQKRRKTLVNGLAGAKLGFGKPELEQILTEANLPPTTRGETLTLEDFIRLTNVLAAHDA